MVALSTIVTDICLAAGLTEDQIDVTDLEEVEIEGYAVSRVMNARSALEPLRMAGLFDYVESGEVLRFQTRGKATVATIPAEALGASVDENPGPAITTRKLQDVELPRQIRLKYLSYARDFEKGEQLSPVRMGTVGVNLVDVDCPVVMTDDMAARLAEIIFRDAWASRWLHEFSLDQSYHHLEAADALEVPINGRSYRVRVLSINDTALVARRIEAVRDDDGSYTSTAVATPPTKPPQTLSRLGQTGMVLLDLPALDDAHDDPGLYLAVYNAGPGTSWSGATIHRSVDGAAYSIVATVGTEAVVGEVVSHPASGDPATWDDASAIVVDILSGTLESRTDADVLAGANALAIGVHGRWHIVQFGTATLVSPGRYSLTHLLLGRRGTEHLIDTVQVGDTVVLVSGSGIYRLPLQTSEVGAERFYRAVTSGATFSSASDQGLTGQGQALETFSPVHVDGTRDGSSNLTISWTRRDRLSQTLRDGVAVPNSETSESYEVDVLDGANVVRTLTSSTASVAYSAADQTTDFGSPQASIAVRVYQLSAIVGRGTPAEATV